MYSKKILVLYFSNSGFTKKLAKEISQNLNSDIEEIKTPVSYNGFIGYQRALLHAIFKRKPIIKKLKHNPEDYDLVVIGGPVWAASVSGPIRSFLENNRDNLKNVVFFLTQGGQYGRIQVLEQMENLCGKTPLAHISVTDKELTDGTYKEKVLSFLSELKEKQPDVMAKKDRKQEYPAGPTRLSSVRPT